MQVSMTSPVLRLVLTAGLLAASAVPRAQTPAAAPTTDLDDFMSRVLERRDDNWKKLQQYVLDERETFQLTVLVNHLRSLNGANSESAGSNGWATAGARVRAKRQKQAESLADLVQDRQAATPAERIVLIGDFNFFEVNDGLVHGMGVVTGAPVPDDETAVAGDGVDLVNPDLAFLQDADPAQAYSFLFDGNAQSLDHAIVNGALMSSTAARRVEHPWINADFPETDRNDYSDGNPKRLADHDPLVLFLKVPGFDASPFRDGFESGELWGYWSCGSEF
jgi:hypothetical protein